jgi:serine phosphatase RsbU (regulator of sigma subunit)
MKRLTLLIIVNAAIYGAFGQINKFGTPITKSYSMQVTQGAEYNWCITKDKFGAVYFGNDNNLVIRYDGSKWTTIPVRRNTTTIVRAIRSDESGIIYVGGEDEFGYIEPDSSGNRVYVSLNDRIPKAKNLTGSAKGDSSLTLKTVPSDFAIGNIYSLIIKGSRIYYLSSRSLIVYDRAEESLSFINLKQLGFKQSMRLFSINDKIIITDNNSGLFELKDEKIYQLPGGEFFGKKISLSVLPFRNDQVIVGTLESGIFLYNYSTGSVDSSFIDSKMFNRLKELRVYCGVKLFSGELVFGTMSDGLFVFDTDGNYIGRWNSQNTEMQDDAVSALYSDPDANSELWIATMGFITKAYVNLPFKQFSVKSGLEGGVNNFCRFNNSVYVATDNGVFKSGTKKEDGTRIFNQLDDITAQVFPLQPAMVGRDSFLLAGSFRGVYRINAGGTTSILKGNLIDAGKEIDRTVFDTRIILQSKLKNNRFYFGLTPTKLRILDYNNGIWKLIKDIKSITGNIYFLKELKNGDLIALTNYPDGLFRVPFNDTVSFKYGPDKGIQKEFSLNSLSELNGEIIVCTAKGILKLNTENDSWIPYDELTGGYTNNVNVDRFFPDPEGDHWLSTSEDRFHEILLTKKNDTLSKYKGGLFNLLPDVKLMHISSIENKTWIAKSKTIYIVDKEKLDIAPPSVSTLLTRIVIKSGGTDSTVMNETFYSVDEKGRRYPVSATAEGNPPEFRYTYNSPSFYWTTPYMIEEEGTLYSYKLEGYEKEWSKWEKIGYKDFTNLKFGNYTFRIKAKTATGIISKEAKYSFSILKPWYLTPLMMLLYVIATIFLVFIIILAYTRRLKNENIRLEGIVAERTAVVVKQKEELESSIHYASRIQMALLPSETILSENIRDYFILFRPRDIVSGDFYWMTKKADRLYIVAADCTGHGVPGAFMSLLGMSFLDEIIDKESAPRADFILNELRLHVTESLKQVGGDDEAKDGMDIALLVVDFNKRRIEFSGAYNPCFRIRKLAEDEVRKYKDNLAEMPDGSMSDGRYLLETIYASKMPIGISSLMNERFIFYDWKLEKGLSYYLFSDGYIDQFGGDHGRKFMKKNFKRLLLEIQDYPLARQKEVLENRLEEWMGKTQQIDDILVLGIRTE